MFGFVFSLSLFASLPPALQSLQKSMSTVKSFEVSFTQTVRQELFPEMTDTASGRLMFTRPSQMQWTYETPKKRTIAFDGKELTIEEGDQIQRIRDSGRITLERSFSFLWGKPDADLFLIESKSAKAFVVKPRRPDDVTFTSIVVTVEGGRVSKALITDKLESQSLLEFSQWKTKS